MDIFGEDSGSIYMAILYELPDKKQKIKNQVNFSTADNFYSVPTVEYGYK